ncbi:MAG: CBM35 domain-containing protein [Verrucomicrobiota bacterium]
MPGHQHQFSKSALLLAFVISAICPNGFSQQEDRLDSLLQKIDHRLVETCEQFVRQSLDQRIERYGAYGVYPRKNRHWTTKSVDVDLEEGHLPNAAARFLRAYETFGEEAYLRAGLQTADFFCRIQHENGCFPTAARLEKGGKATAIIGRKHKHPIGVARIEDAHQYPAFCLLLYAHKLTGQKKYLNSAKKWGDLFFEKIQYRDWGCSPDYWDGKARPHGEAYVEGDDWDYGVPNGGSYSDHATYDGFMTTLVMYHLTGDPKYLQYSSKLGQWIFLTHRGKGATRGWADNYNRLNEPVPARHHEGFNIDPRNANRFTLPMMMWFHVMTGEARYRVLFEETIAWLRSVEHPHGPDAPRHPWFGGASLEPIGWPSEYLPDGNEAWTTGHRSYRYDQPLTWPEKLRKLGLANGGHPKYTTLKVNLAGAEQMLAILRSQGLAGWRQLFQGNAKWTPARFLEERFEAARRCLATPTLPATLDEQWQMVWDFRLAAGKINVRHAAYGGHGLLKWTESFTDLWNVHYDWTSRVLAVDNWLDVPIPELQGFREAEEGTVTGATVKQEVWGYSGAGYIQPGGGPTSITWNVESPHSGAFKMVIIWANRSGVDRPMDLIVNDAAPRTCPFPGSSNGNQWNGHVVDVAMQTGANRITLRSEGGGPHLDMIYFTEPVSGSSSRPTEPR